MADYAYAFKPAHHHQQHHHQQQHQQQQYAQQQQQQHYRAAEWADGQANANARPHYSPPPQQQQQSPPQRNGNAPSQPHPHSTPNPNSNHPPGTANSLSANGPSSAPANGGRDAPAALIWSDLEPWMDAEYARQVCALMRWDAAVRVDAPIANSGNNSFASNAAAAGVSANNAGYCVLTFASAGMAQAALAQVNAPGAPPMTMPNSARAFVLAWAPPGAASVSGVGSGAAASAPPPATNASANGSAPTTNGNGVSGANGNGANGNASGNANGNGAYAQHAQGVVSPTSPLSPVHAIAMGAHLGGSGMNVSGGGGVGEVGAVVGGGPAGPYPKEYSIFVGDLAPETSNSDLVAVFRNPVLGLRNDRAPKFIRPFASCKSAKIMLDPVTGVSRGYGFVRFTDEADQQRALIEMHGLYCLSRPMRISPATAKFKPPPPDLAQLTSLPPPTASTTANPAPASVATPGFPGYTSVVSVTEQAQAQGQQGQQQAPPQSQTQSVSAPIAVPYYAPQQQQTPEYGGGAQEYFAQFPASQQQQQQPTHQQQPAAQQQQQQDPTAAEWKHHAHARAILGNLIGPNGEQLTSTDPYNTTVFVGGLSPLVGEETLRTFFVPFGEIHYVKVPVGKHCGFVQFVRKADAERAIEKMQGFPVGGSRIRLSWGRSQYKAAQAAAQAAQAAALQAAASAPAQPATPTAQPNAGLAGITPAVLSGMTQEQAIMLLQKFGVPGYVAAPNAYAPPPAAGSGYAPPANANTFAAPSNVNGGGYAAPPNANYVPTPSGNNGADSYRSSLHSSSPSNSNLGAAANANAGASNTPQPQFTEENLKVRRDDGPFGYTQQRAYEVAGPAGSTFSPFSPDPNQQQGLYAAAELLGTRRDSYSAALPHPSKAYAPGFFPVAPVLQTPASAGGGKMAVGGGASPTRGYGGGFAGSPPAFQINRYQAHPQAQTQPISRPNSGSAARSSGERERERAHEEFDSMHDLNGTLASLDLDRERELGLGDRPWSLKSPIPESSSEESTSSGGSVQFRMKRTPSP